MKIQAKKNLTINKNDTIAVFITKEDLNLSIQSLPEELNFTKDLIDFEGFSGEFKESIFVPLADYPSIIVIGIGEEKKIDSEIIRNASSEVIKITREKRIKSFTVVAPKIFTINSSVVLKSLTEGLYLSNYDFNFYKSADAKQKAPLIEKVMVVSSDITASKVIAYTEIDCNNTIACRDMVNQNSDYATAKYIAAEAKKFAKIPGVTVKVMSRKDIIKNKMGLLEAVNRGSEIPAHLVILTYKGAPKNNKSFAIVGKGVTFDSGGINLKPTGSMETMRMDMAGAAAALYSFKSIAQLKMKKNIYAVLPLTDNMVSNDPYRPGDVLTAYNGKTVEIGNTDAEGRLILGDALAYTVKNLKPDYIIDLATLTGACVVTFGETTAAYLSNNDEIADLIEKSSEITGDKSWRLPLDSDYDEHMKSDIADLRNTSNEKSAGTITGAVFLKNFVDETKWAHIDIAGTAWSSKVRGYRPKNATGYGVRLITEVISQW
jgi:leucyl aminopeptidase